MGCKAILDSELAYKSMATAVRMRGFIGLNVLVADSVLQQVLHSAQMRVYFFFETMRC